MGIILKTEKHKGIPIFEVEGRISGEEALKISRKLEDFVREPFYEIILDLSAIDFIDSNWLGIFAYCIRIYRERRKRIIFIVKSEFVHGILLNSNIDRLATIARSFDAV